MTREATTTQWVCTHCFIHMVNGDCTETDTCGTGVIPEPMHLFGNMEVTPGSLDHECRDEGGELADECECERQSFTWSACDGCGDPCGGERHAVTGWIERHPRVWPNYIDNPEGGK